MSLTDTQRAALQDAREGLYRSPHGFRKGFGPGGALHKAATVLPLIRRKLIRRPFVNERLHHITDQGQLALAGIATPVPHKPRPPALAPAAPILVYKED